MILIKLFARLISTFVPDLVPLLGINKFNLIHFRIFPINCSDYKWRSMQPKRKGEEFYVTYKLHSRFPVPNLSLGMGNNGRQMGMFLGNQRHQDACETCSE